MRPLRTEILAFGVATLAHAAALFALAALDESAADASAESAPLILEFFAETPVERTETPPEPEAETEEKDAEAAAGAPAVAADALPAESPEDAAPLQAAETEAALPPPPPDPAPEPTRETLTEAAHDAAPGEDGNARGDGLDADETLGVPAPEEPAEPKAPAVPATEGAPAPASAPEEVRERGGERIGKRGDPSSAREGDFGSGGNGADATATVRYRRRVAPKYPRADALAGRTGTVVLLLDIDERGALTGVRVKRSSGSPSLDAAAIRAARASEYLPAREGARAVPSRAEVDYTFAR
ncbi:TonB family protein [Candidatus Spyradosoma sp. SGI.093]|uniref:TonB family protein n=1 Tax=Candidatus Spyradosoma sp. SGI.093 TaxID=3420583 RepID=UPI003D022D79